MLETNKNSRNSFFVSFIFHALIAYALLFGVEQKADTKRIDENIVVVSLSSFETTKTEQQKPNIEQILKQQVAKKVQETQMSMTENIKKWQEHADIEKTIESPKSKEIKEQKEVQRALVDSSIKRDDSKQEINSMQNIKNTPAAKIEQKEESSIKNTQDSFTETSFHSIRDKVLEKLKYPPIAKRMKQAGVVEVLLVIDTNGKLIEVTIHKSSGYKLLDSSAMSAASELSAQTLPIPQKNSKVILPIYFVLD